MFVGPVKVRKISPLEAGVREGYVPLSQLSTGSNLVNVFETLKSDISDFCFISGGDFVSFESVVLIILCFYNFK